MKRNIAIKLFAAGLCLLLGVGTLFSCGSAEKNSAMPQEDGITVENSYGSNLVDKNESIDATVGDTGEYDTKIIRTADITAETKEFENAVENLKTHVTELGGYVESSSVRGRSENVKNSYRSAEFSLRIPAEKLDQFLALTGELLNVTYSNTKDEDISGSYYDMETRLGVLNTERQVLERMLAEAAALEDMITLEERLYDVIYEIESYQTQLKVYDSKIAYSTVKLTLSEVADLTTVVENPGFWARFKKAAVDGWRNFTEGCQDFAIELVYALPTLVILAIIVTVGIILLCTWIKRRKKKKNESKE